jgi:hypothetical protein
MNGERKFESRWQGFDRRSMRGLDLEMACKWTRSFESKKVQEYQADGRECTVRYMSLQRQGVQGAQRCRVCVGCIHLKSHGCRGDS